MFNWMFDVISTSSNECKGGENAAAKLDDGMGASGIARLGDGYAVFVRRAA
jgi:hypothetical protein